MATLAPDLPAQDPPSSADGVGSSPLPSSSGSSPAVGPDRMGELARAVAQPFTLGTLVGAAERDGIAISEALAWLRDAETRGAVRETGERRSSRTALRGARLLETDR